VTPRPDLDTLARVRRVRDRMDRDYARPLDVESLARSVHLSAGHLSRQFVRAYGETPYSYLMTRRIERAMTLLRTTESSVSEICIAVGCQSLGTFSTRFRELVGVSPREYRERGAPFRPGMLPCIAKRLTRPVRNREDSAARPRIS
jgi:transcriptional regulator GlxA family with amidase domain